jgi:hypothetical protein
MEIDLVYLFSILFSSQGLGFSGCLQTRIFPVLHLFDTRAGSNDSTWPNISGHQLRSLECPLSCTT